MIAHTSLTAGCCQQSSELQLVEATPRRQTSP